MTSAPDTQRDPTGVVHLLREPSDDAELLAALHEPTPSAAALVFDRFGEDVNRLVWRLLGADAEHDDIVQQVFLAIVNSLGRLRDPSALRAWVVSVTVRTVRTELRRRRYRRLVHFDSTITERAEAGNRIPEDGRVAQGVQAALAKMHESYRVPFVLRVVEEMSLIEVAEACGCSLATAKRRIERGRAEFGRLAVTDPHLATLVNSNGETQ